MFSLSPSRRSGAMMRYEGGWSKRIELPVRFCRSHQLFSGLRAHPDTATNARCRVRVERRIHPAGVQPARVAAG
jgi:hypothetical protein